MKTHVLKMSLFFSAALLTLSAFSFEETSINNLQGQIQGVQGSGQVDSWKLPSQDAQGQTAFVFFKENTQFRVQTDDSEFLWEGVPDFLLELEEARWSGVYGHAKASQLNLSVGLLTGEGKDDGVDLRSLKANCQGTHHSQDLLFQLLETCSQTGSLSFSRLELVDKNPLVASVLKVVAKSLQIQAESTVLENLEFDVKKGSFNFKLKAHLDFKVNVKGNGKITFDEHKGEIKIRLDKVKASFLNITDRVFKEVEDLNMPNVFVSKPYITISQVD